MQPPYTHCLPPLSPYRDRYQWIAERVQELKGLATVILLLLLPTLVGPATAIAIAVVTGFLISAWQSR